MISAGHPATQVASNPIDRVPEGAVPEPEELAVHVGGDGVHQLHSGRLRHRAQKTVAVGRSGGGLRSGERRSIAQVLRGDHIEPIRLQVGVFHHDRLASTAVEFTNDRLIDIDEGDPPPCLSEECSEKGAADAPRSELYQMLHALTIATLRRWNKRVARIRKVSAMASFAGGVRSWRFPPTAISFR